MFADSLASPYFSDRPMFESAEWFGVGGDVLRSFAYVALRADRPLGVLAMASPEPDRFTTDMGTELSAQPAVPDARTMAR